MKNDTILKWALVVAIVVVLNLLFNVTNNLIYPRPQYDVFCRPELIQETPVNAQACVAQGGQWNGLDVSLKPVVGTEPKGYCDLQFTCRQEFEQANTVYNRNSFIILVILGAVSLVLGFTLTSLSAVSLGLSLGGLLSLVIASIRYWSYMQEYWRFVVLALALVALIWLGIKKIKD